jgi:DNA repair protein RAD50
MSTIGTLGISGVRSYSSQQQEVINFKTPLTLILGKNGSGKTVLSSD